MAIGVSCTWKEDWWSELQTHACLRVLDPNIKSHLWWDVLLFKKYFNKLGNITLSRFISQNLLKIATGTPLPPYKCFINKQTKMKDYINMQCISWTLCNACCLVNKEIIADRNSGPRRPNGTVVTGPRFLTNDSCGQTGPLNCFLKWSLVSCGT